MVRQSIARHRANIKIGSSRKHKALAANVLSAKTKLLNATGSGGQVQNEAKRTSRVNVAPYVKMVKGKPVYVAGYSYTRKA